MVVLRAMKCDATSSIAREGGYGGVMGGYPLIVPCRPLGCLPSDCTTCVAQQSTCNAQYMYTEIPHSRYGPYQKQVAPLGIKYSHHLPSIHHQHELASSPRLSSNIHYHKGSRKSPSTSTWIQCFPSSVSSPTADINVYWQNRC